MTQPWPYPVNKFSGRRMIMMMRVVVLVVLLATCDCKIPSGKAKCSESLACGSSLERRCCLTLSVSRSQTLTGESPVSSAENYGA